MGRVFATSDWHGCDFYKKILNFLQEDDILFFIGDSIDRGPVGIEVFDALYFDKRVTMLKGNHEDMLADYLVYMKNEHLDRKFEELYSENGGDPTLKSLKNTSIAERDWYIDVIRKLPEQLIYHSPKGHSIILEHAGFTPFDIPHRTHDPLWDRGHFKDRWSESQEYQGLTPANTYIVHGHTPVQVVKYYFGYIDQPTLTEQEMQEKREFSNDAINSYTIKPTILHYCSGHKIDIDMCTVISNRIALLDLDTFEAIYFDKEN